MGTKNYTFKFLEDDNSDEMLTSLNNITLCIFHLM